MNHNIRKIYEHLDRMKELSSRLEFRHRVVGTIEEERADVAYAIDIIKRTDELIRKELAVYLKETV